ncbi:hypothetical protein E4U12_008111 [Claviceps purpurea]|nr:hypothetical protein E4U12_008111 [Claviceps purpurea]
MTKSTSLYTDRANRLQIWFRKEGTSHHSFTLVPDLGADKIHVFAINKPTGLKLTALPPVCVTPGNARTRQTHLKSRRCEACTVQELKPATRMAKMELYIATFYSLVSADGVRCLELKTFCGAAALAGSVESRDRMNLSCQAARATGSRVHPGM